MRVGPGKKKKKRGLSTVDSPLPPSAGRSLLPSSAGSGRGSNLLHATLAMLYYYNEGKSEKGEGEKKKKRGERELTDFCWGIREEEEGEGRGVAACNVVAFACFPPSLPPSFPNVSPAGSFPSLDASLAERRGMNVE